MFRDPEREAIAGVCSGIAAYFGIQDPLWVRLVFILLTISGFFGLIVYLILWAVVPKAESSSDRLAMRGEPANVENISKIIEEELDHVSQKVSELGEELKSEFASKKKLSQERMKKKSLVKGLPSGAVSVRPLPKGFMF